MIPYLLNSCECWFKSSRKTLESLDAIQNRFISSFSLRIRESDIACYSKSQWKKIMKEKIVEKNCEDLLDQIKGYKKLNYSELSKESFKKKDYFEELIL